jgi:hypothetical protein
MAKYIVNSNAQADGYHEVHNEDTCNHLPDVQNRVLIGNYNNCFEAVSAIKQQNPSHSIDGCYYCCNACHTR